MKCKFINYRNQFSWKINILTIRQFREKIESVSQNNNSMNGLIRPELLFWRWSGMAVQRSRGGRTVCLGLGRQGQGRAGEIQIRLKIVVAHFFKLFIFRKDWRLLETRLDEIFSIPLLCYLGGFNLSSHPCGSKYAMLAIIQSVGLFVWTIFGKRTISKGLWISMN